MSSPTGAAPAPGTRAAGLLSAQTPASGRDHIGLPPGRQYPPLFRVTVLYPPDLTPTTTPRLLTISQYSPRLTHHALQPRRQRDPRPHRPRHRRLLRVTLHLLLDLYSSNITSIGAAVARDLWAHGAHLALTYSSNASGLEDLAAALRAQDPDPSRRISLHRLDLAVDDDLPALASAFASAHGQPGPDILISNAGVAGLDKKSTPLLKDISVDEFDYTTNINLRAAFRLCKFAVPHMADRRWGRVVFVSSISAIGGGINGCHVTTS